MFLKTLKLRPRQLIVGVLFTATLLANAGVTLTTNAGAKVSDVISTIQKQSGYRFFYDDDIANLNVKAVTLNDDNVNDALKKLFDGTNISYVIKDNVIYLKKND